MKSALRNNLKGLKKEEEKEGGDQPSGVMVGGSSNGNMSSRRVRLI